MAPLVGNLLRGDLRLMERVVGVSVGVSFDMVDGSPSGVEFGVVMSCEDREDVFSGVLKGDLKGLESAGEGLIRRRFLGGEGAGSMAWAESEELMTLSSSGSSVESASSSNSPIATITGEVFEGWLLLGVCD